MTAANDNRIILSPEKRQAFIDKVLEEFDLLCLGTPSPLRIERELAIAGFE